MSVHRLIGQHSVRNPEAIALLAPGRAPITYGHLQWHCEAIAARLNRAGIARGDRVAVVLPNGPELAAAFLAVSMTASCAPLNPGYRASEYEFYLTALAPKALIVEDGEDSPAVGVAEARGIRVIRMRRETDSPSGIFSLDLGEAEVSATPMLAEPDDEALVLFTSGTTARPKMVALTHANLAASVENIVASMSLTSRDRSLNVMPLFHVSGIVGVLLASLASGGSVVCTPGFYAPRFFDWCHEFAPSWYFAVPTMHQSVLARAHENPSVLSNLSLRFIRSGAAPLPPQLMNEMERVFEVPVVEGYGLTETSMQVSINPLPPGVRKAGSVGIAGATRVAVLDQDGSLLPSGETGEIAVRGPAVFAGYANDRDASRESFANGWFRTGDRGRLDADGYLYVTGRIKEIIIRGGQKISPREIDEVLGAHPAVAQAVAFAIPDERLGEDIVAAVVLKRSEAVSEHALRSFAAERLADFKVPGRIVFLDEIPIGSTGKVQRREMAARFGIRLETTETLTESPFVGPETATQKLLAEVWRTVLGVEQVGIHDHFLALGGDSLLLAQVISRLRELGGPPITMLTFFERPTVAGLASLIDSESGLLLSSSVSVVQARPTPNGRGIDQPTRTSTVEATPVAASASRGAARSHWPIQPHGARPPLYVVGSFNAFVPLAQRLGPDQPVLGVAVPDELKLQIPYRLEELAASQVDSILEAQANGPYFLAGFSAEGVLAYEVAQQLAAKGHPVELLVMIDSACPSVHDPFVLRMMRNARIHAGHVASGGLQQLRYTATGIWRRFSLRMKIHGWRLGRPIGIPISRPSPREPMDVILANVIASRAYVPRPYAGRVLLFKRTEELIGRYRLQDNGWRRVVRGGLEVVNVAGGHLALLAEPGVARVATELAAAMRAPNEARTNLESSSAAAW